MRCITVFKTVCCYHPKLDKSSLISFHCCGQLFWQICPDPMPHETIHNMLYCYNAQLFACHKNPKLAYHPFLAICVC
jgi:hypothetical protein